jgi:hypothetical protein
MSAASYEGAGGWTDGRLGQAYDLIAEVIAGRGGKPLRHPLLAEIEALDIGLSDPTDCPHCDGFGRCWNNADPTSGQFVACSCERGTDDPPAA